MEIKQDRMMRWYVTTAYGRIYYPNKSEAEKSLNRVGQIMADIENFSSCLPEDNCISS